MGQHYSFFLSFAVFPDLQMIAALTITCAKDDVLAKRKDAMDFEIAETFQMSITVVSIEKVAVKRR